MRQLIAIITLLGAFSASAQTSLPIDFPVGIRALSTASGTCADGKTSVTVASQNAGTVAIDVSGTWTGTLAFYGSTKNGTYQSISATPIAGGSAVSTTTGNGTWFANAAGFVTVCAAFNASAVTGSASVQLNASNAIIPVAGSGGGGGVISGIVGVDGGTIQLLAGTAIAGKFGIDQTTPGTTNGVVVNSSALPSGAATASGLTTINTTLGTPMQNSGGSVTANLGTLNGAATSALQTTGNSSLSSIATNTSPLATAQAATTAGLTGPLMQAAAVNSASYSSGQTYPLTMDTGGNLNVKVGNLLSTGVNVAQISGSSVTTTSTAGEQKVGVEGLGTAGSASGGVLTVQGTSSGTAIPVTANAGTNLNTSLLATDAHLTALGTTALVTDAHFQGGVKLLDSGGSTQDTIKAASTASATTDTALVVTQSPNPSPECNSFIAINQTAGTTVITGTASKYTYICSIVLISATAQNVSVIEGTGTVCASGTPIGMLGGTTASMAFNAGGGLVSTSDRPHFKGRTAADNICVVQSASGNVSGWITYATAN